MSWPLARSQARSVRSSEAETACCPSGVTAAPFTDTRRQLAQSLVSPVRWRETVQQLGATVRRFVELAPGEVLSKMARRTVHGVPRMTAEKELQERDNP